MNTNETLLDEIEVRLIRLGMLLRLLEGSADEDVSAAAEVIGVQVRDLAELASRRQSTSPEGA